MELVFRGINAYCISACLPHPTGPSPSKTTNAADKPHFIMAVPSTSLPIPRRTLVRHYFFNSGNLYDCYTLLLGDVARSHKGGSTEDLNKRPEP